MTGGAVTSPRLLIPGDTLEISCPESAACCLTRSLTAAGNLFLPSTPPISLANLDLRDAEMKIAQALEGVVADAQITIRLVPGVTRRVTIAGAVASPLTTSFGAGITLPDLLASARPRPDADLRHVRIVGIDGETVIADSTARSWALRAGDRVEVPLATPPDEVLVLGGVERPGTLTLEDEMTVAEAVTLAGGVSAFGTTRDWRVINAEERSETIPDLRAASTRRLKPGDSVFVPYHSAPNYVVILGAVAQPTGVPVEGALHLREALKAAGGAMPDADLHHVLIRPGFGKPVLIVDATIAPTIRGADPVLDAGDSVVVPRLRVKARP